MKKIQYLVITAALLIVAGTLLMPAQAAETRAPKSACEQVADFAVIAAKARDNGDPSYKMDAKIDSWKGFNEGNKASLKALNKRIYEAATLSPATIGGAAYDGCMH